MIFRELYGRRRYRRHRARNASDDVARHRAARNAKPARMYFTGRCVIECGIDYPQPDDRVVGADLPRHFINLGLRSPRGPLATSGPKMFGKPDA
jgi:hypothetical protein